MRKKADLLCPGTIDKYIGFASIFADTYDVQVIRSNHKVNMDQRIIHTFFQNFLVAHLQKSIEHLRETGASGNVE